MLASHFRLASDCLKLYIPYAVILRWHPPFVCIISGSPETGHTLRRGPFETDLPAAAMARRLGCPVMSNDSDFLTLGVTCVQIPKAAFVSESAPSKSRRRQCPGQTSYSVTCNVFHPKR